MNAIEILKKRRSIRKYKDIKIKDDDLNLILEMGLNSPSAHDTRPWKFCVFKNNDKKYLINSMNKTLENDMRKINIDEKIIKAKIDKSKKVFSTSQVIIVGFGKVINNQNRLDKSGEIEKVLCEQSVAMSVMQMINTATLLGISSCIFSAPLFCPDVILKHCNLEKNEWQPRTLITLGYSDEEKLKTKSPIDFNKQVLFFDK